MTIMGNKVSFAKVKHLLTFGIKKSGIRFSDSEKTILDIFYLKSYRWNVIS